MKKYNLDRINCSFVLEFEYCELLSFTMQSTYGWISFYILLIRNTRPVTFGAHLLDSSPNFFNNDLIRRRTICLASLICHLFLKISTSLSVCNLSVFLDLSLRAVLLTWNHMPKFSKFSLGLLLYTRIEIVLVY